ncbi:MAG: NTP transferase domain-containing protein, partial [Caldilineaceae bacterium]|nr:NTP transferase domain-containing protein [Caldilineaceae bacterium]
MMGSRSVRNGSIAVVILAAGRSSRMGYAKQVAAVQGVPMIVRAVDVALACGADSTWIVLGAHAAAIEELLAPICERNAKLHLLHNAAWATGQAGSVHCAITAVPADVGAALFLPVDQP